MKKIIKSISVILLITLLSVSIPFDVADNNVSRVEAHSGRTDSSGGHHDNKNKSGLGDYHYHCGGYEAHLHKDGVCPYSNNSSNTEKKTTKKKTTKKKSTKKKSKVSKETIEAVQIALNDRGYNCGEPDGIMGKKTKAALIEYQEDYGLTVDGIIGNEVKESLNIK